MQVHCSNCCLHLLLQISFIEDLGCEISAILKDVSGEVLNPGSNSGLSFLMLNPDVNLKFRQHFCKCFTYISSDAGVFCCSEATDLCTTRLIMGIMQMNGH